MDRIAIIDFGGQYTHLIARRIRNLGVYSEIYNPEDFHWVESIKGIIFSGGPQSVNAKDCYRIDFDLKSSTVPVLGICYGHQMVASMLGGTIESGENTEYGFTKIDCLNNSNLFSGLEQEQHVWMSHGDHVASLPDGFRVTAKSDTIKIAAYQSNDGRFYGFQFHPEVTHSVNGQLMLDNFLKQCNVERNWNSTQFKDDLIAEIREKASGKKLILLLSGGVDSMVALQLCISAVGNDDIFSFHVDTGFMRLNESEKLKEHFSEMGFRNIKILNVEDRYLKELHKITDPETKRLIIGRLFVEIADEEMRKLDLDDNWMLVQGTIYPDTIESGDSKKSAKIKTHHNRVGEIENLIKQGKVIEPLKELYKDEVRALGRDLGLPDHLVNRHPFPGPGLAIRVICSDGKNSDEKYLDENSLMNEILDEFDLEGMIMPIKSVGVQGDFRTYHHPAVVWFKDGCKMDWSKIREASIKAVNQLKTVNRINFSLRKPSKLKLVSLYLEKPEIDKLRRVDQIMRHRTDGIEAIWQMPVVSLPLQNDEGNQCFVIRPVCSQDAMSADFYEMDFRQLDSIEQEVCQLKEVGNIFYDVTSKPPGTIEWE